MEALGHQDLDPDKDPTGEELLDRSRQPFKFWVPPARVLVVGHSQVVEREIRVEAARRGGLPVHRRMGGGGAVLLSPACVCVGLRFAKSKGLTLHDYFEAGSDLIRRAVSASLGKELQTHGLSDLAHAGPSGLRKVAGCSLYMPRDFALYLASILVNPDFREMETYLAHPSREPDYRGGRTHRDFLAGLREIAGRDIQAEELLPPLHSALADGLKAELDWPSRPSLA